MAPSVNQTPQNPGADDSGKGSSSGGLSGPRLVYPLLAGWATLSLISRGCSPEKEHTSGPGLAKLPATTQFASMDEALKAVKTQQYVPMEEVSSPESAYSAIIFKQKGGDHNAILRGVSVGQERTEFLKELKNLGHEVPTSVFSTTTAVAGQSAPQPAASKPVYEPFIMPTALLLITYAAFKGISKFGKAIGEAITKVGGPLNPAQPYTTERPVERLNNYGGNKEVLAKIERLVSDIKRVMKGESKVKLPKGFLLSGDPGVGKSFLMRCVAGEAECPIIIAAAAALRTSPFQGARAKGIEDLFSSARAARDARTKELRSMPGASGKEEAVVLVVLDEIDSIGRSRSMEHDSSENNDAINALLANMDGANSARNHHIVLFGATNYVDVIDSALRRPGRFNKDLKIDPPATAADRLDVLEKLAPGVFADYDCRPPSAQSMKYLAEAISSATPADLKGILEEAGRDTPTGIEVSLEELLAAYQTVKLGALRQSTERSERRLLVSAHEFGHALVAYAFDLDPVIISMRPRGDSLGRVIMNLGPLVEPPHTASDLKKLMMVSAAGRGGELAFLGGTGEASDGVGSDFENISTYSKVFLGSGMLDGSYSLGLHGKKDVELPAAQQQSLEAIGDAAVLAAAKILRAIPANTFDKIANNATDQEFFGPAAKAYLESHLSSVQLNDLKAAGRAALLEFSTLVHEQSKILSMRSTEETGSRIQDILKSRVDG